jgi:hypothetical protein
MCTLLMSIFLEHMKGSREGNVSYNVSFYVFKMFFFKINFYFFTLNNLFFSVFTAF